MENAADKCDIICSLITEVTAKNSGLLIESKATDPDGYLLQDDVGVTSGPNGLEDYSLVAGALRLHGRLAAELLHDGARWCTWRRLLAVHRPSGSVPAQQFWFRWRLAWCIWPSWQPPGCSWRYPSF